MPQKYVRVDGVATFVHHVGPTTLPEVRPCSRAARRSCVCTARAATRAVFVDLLARLEPTHSPLAFDRPGHARSGGLDACLDRAHERLHARVLRALGIERCVLLGASMGGCVALEAALEAPERVRALVLVAGRARDEPRRELEKLRLITKGKARREFDRAAYSPRRRPT